MSTTVAARLAALPGLKAFWPAPVAVDRRERLRMVAGAGLGIVLTALLCHRLGSASALAWIIAPMGASAVLVFCVPASPLAQPWAVVGGNTVSAIVGVACARWIGPVDLAAAAAVALAIAAMLALRCLHPPGGATALLMALGGVTDPHAVLAPVLLNALVLTACGVAYNSATRRPYPHTQVMPPSARDAATEHDLDAVLARYNQVLDVSRDDLQALLESTQMRALERRLADTRCADIMSREPKTVEFGTSLQEAWALFRQHRIKALPVVDKWRHVIGIVTLADFLNAADLDVHHGFDARLRSFIRATPASHSDKPEVVGQIMSRKVRVTSERRHLADLVPLFGSTGHHHIPVIGDGERLVGIITQSDVVAALSAPQQPLGA
ncbi:MAG: HPP family protein [Burkholderiales bacterium]|nr:HPP family protein [Burkholderiales bacterium]